MLIKVLSYNIHKGRHWSGLKENLPQMRDLIIKTGADIVLLQEVVGEKLKKGRKNSSHLEYLSDSIWSHYSYGKNAVYTKGHHGNAILSKFPILNNNNYDLSINKLEQRGLLYAKVDLDPQYSGTKTLDLFCTHLNLLHRDRKKQYEKISDIFFKNFNRDSMSIFAGDFNDWNQKSLKLFSERHCYEESFMQMNKSLPKTFPSFFPLLSLDRFFSKNVKVIKAKVLTGKSWATFSDHLALLVEVEV